MTAARTLPESRFQDAEVSQGISSDDIYRAIEEVIRQRDLKGALLDFGAGTGNLLNRLESLKRFSHLSGTDILPRPGRLSFAIAWMQQDLNDPLSCADSAFDVVVASETIEHLENPRALAREWFRILRPGGTLVVTTPNNESWRSILALIFRGHFVFFGGNQYPAHKTALVRKDLERLLREAGFGNPEIRFTNVGGIPKWPQVHWQTISAGVLRGVRFSDNVLAVAQKPRV